MDINLHSYVAPDNNGQSVLLAPEDPWPAPDAYSSCIKISGGVQFFTVRATGTKGGRDACVDLNNKASGVSVFLDEPEPRGQFAVTCKGGASFIHLSLHNIKTHGKVTDIMLDDWSDQSHEPTKNIVLDCTMQDGSPVRVLALKEKPITVQGSGPYKFPWWTALNVKIGPYYLIGSSFEVLRRLGLFRSQSN